MPHQDQYGRWISDDGAYWWDGAVWRPVRPPSQAPRASHAPYYIGAGCAGLLLLVILMGICTSYFLTQLPATGPTP
jgi:hypothetical protein